MSKFHKKILVKLLNKYKACLEKELSKPKLRFIFVPSVSTEEELNKHKDSLRKTIDYVDNILQTLVV